MVTDGHVNLDTSRWATRCGILSGEFAGVLEDVFAGVTDVPQWICQVRLRMVEFDPDTRVL